MAIKLFAFPSDWGWLGLAVSESGLAGVILPSPFEESARAALKEGWPSGLLAEADPWPEIRLRLLDYFGAKRSDFSDVPLDLPKNPPFFRRVWEICARIPYGETRSYGDLAREAGSPKAFRAVGGAMAANPIPIVIPCHRVLGSNGSLTGFGGGLDLKRRMLGMEALAR